MLPARYIADEHGRTIEVEPSRPAPPLMTEDEAVRYLRLDTTATKNPGDTLERYRSMGLLRGTQVGRRVFYRLVELDKFLDRQTDAVAR